MRKGKVFIKRTQLRIQWNFIKKKSEKKTNWLVRCLSEQNEAVKDAQEKKKEKKSFTVIKL